MRPERFQEFAVKALTQAPDIRTVEPWNEGARRPFGVKIEFTTGAQIWHAITYTMAPGEKMSEPEAPPVEGEAPAEVPWPELIKGGKIDVRASEQYLVAAILNAGNAEVAEASGYSLPEKPALHPGFSVQFHNGSKIFCVYEYALRSGERPGTKFDLPEAV
ncbi:hypothetical protein IPZ58_07605 [Streptomyces roseoverticillatus]|uniref:hypothetical protein n=1 Tax=Streptomyces roseoverticillatus TaxID=66429 RepID=UPI001F26FF97|nr:hypothetical protein [Streptomyces roseoverticillatus]MCF3101445.1 hypothetical protein [Streptomyces roseoverticillatus]